MHADFDCAEETVCRLFVERRRIAHRRLQTHGPGYRGLNGALAQLEQPFGAFADAADNRHSRYAALGAPFGHAHRHLAKAYALPINASLAGDGQGNAFQLRAEIHCVQHRVNPAPELRAQHAAQRRAKTARRACARERCNIPARRRCGNLREMRHASLQLLADFRRCALLRAVNPRRAVFAQQRVGHIANDGDFRMAKLRQKTAEIGFGYAGQRAADRRDGLTRRVCEHSAQRLQHADAAIVCGAAADADENFPHALTQRFGDHLARAKAGCPARVTLRQRHIGKTAGLRHFHHGGYAVAQQTPLRRFGLEAGACYLRADASAVHGAQKSVHRSFPAVCHRNTDGLGIRKMPCRHPLQNLADFKRGKRLLERIRRKYQLHVASPVCGQGEARRLRPNRLFFSDAALRR